MRVSLGVVTYNRSDNLFDQFLEALYVALTATVAPDEIIIINNDEASFEASLEEKVSQAKEAWLKRSAEEAKSDVLWPDIVVKTSSEKNLAVARNLALDTARAPLLALIDDDQKVGADWLASLISCQEQYKADVVAGPVLCEYPPSAPLWLQRADIHNTKGLSTGDQLYGITAGNSLIRLSTLDGLRFDSQFGRSGGEDTDFFKRLFDSKHDIRWCSEAVSIEWIEPTRAKAGYAVRRFISQGSTYRKIALADASTGEALVFYARSALLAIISSVVAIAFILLKRESAGDWVKRCFANVGKLTLHSGGDYS